MSTTSNKNTPKSCNVSASAAPMVADAYEYTMAEANIVNGIAGIPSVFNAALRGMPTNKVVGEFEHEGVTYPKLEKRNFMINCGLEQVLALVTSTSPEGMTSVKNYFKDVLGNKNEEFLDWLDNFEFKGDLFAMDEGVPFFSHEPLVKVRDSFENAQPFESVILSVLNREINVATTAHDVYSACSDKILLEGASRRAMSQQDAVMLSRAALIGGFTATSNVGFGVNYNEKVGGTHGHSYVLLYGNEYEAFTAQAKLHGDNTTFLLDTYGDIKTAMFIALMVVEEQGLKHWKYRLDSGDLLEQAIWIHRVMKECDFTRDQYDIVASDDLNAGKIAAIEAGGGDIASYLMGTFLSIQSKGPGIVFKLTARSDDSGNWVPTAKYSENPAKATIGGDIQIYRIEGPDGFYVRDVIALADEQIGKLFVEGEKARGLLRQKIKGGKLVAEIPTIVEIQKTRDQEIAKFKDIENYPVVQSDAVKAAQKAVRKEIEKQKSEVVISDKFKSIFDKEVGNLN